MQEKIITGRKYGMAVLLGYLALLAAAVLAIIFGAVRGHVFFVVLGVLYVSLGWIALCGLRILKPQEALVLTLFGKYIGTLKGEGFYYVNPFCSAVNPAANTKLSQSGDVDGAKNGIVIAAGQTSGSIEVAGNKKISQDHDAQQLPPEDQRLSRQPRGDRHCGHVARGGHGEGRL